MIKNNHFMSIKGRVVNVSYRMDFIVAFLSISSAIDSIVDGLYDFPPD